MGVYTEEIKLEIRAKELWKSISNFLRADLANIWTVDIKEDLSKLASYVERIEHYLNLLEKYYDENKIEKQKNDVKELLKLLRHPKSDVRWVKYVHDDLMELTEDLDEETVREIREMTSKASFGLGLSDVIGAKEEFTAEKVAIITEEVLKFFRKQGIRLKKVPRIKITHEICKFNPHALALVLIELEGYREMLAHPLVKELTKKFYSEVYGIPITDEALEELSIQLLSDLERMYKLYSFRNTDIMIFQPFFMNINTAKAFLAHELWHLIELQELGRLSFLIKEGTATYVQQFYSNGDLRNQLAEANNFYSFLYGGVGEIVSHYIGHTKRHRGNKFIDFIKRKKPLLKLLDLGVRAHIEHTAKQYLDRLFPKFIKTERNSLFNLKTFTSRKREFHLLRGNLNKPTLIKVYQLIGCPKFADLLSKSNVDKFLGALKRIGY